MERLEITLLEAPEELGGNLISSAQVLFLPTGVRAHWALAHRITHRELLLLLALREALAEEL
jgi:hypothetical protein